MLKLTADHVEEALADDRHLGFGYATRSDLRLSVAAKLDRAVAAVANEHDLDAEILFAWTNSKYGRWLVDDVAGCGAPPTQATVRKYLNTAALVVLAEEGALA